MILKKPLTHYSRIDSHAPCYFPSRFTSSDEYSYAQADGDEGVLFTWTGSASTVELVGEWDWDSAIPMSESGGIWSATVDLADGLYCYKFIVDGNFND